MAEDREGTLFDAMGAVEKSPGTFLLLLVEAAKHSPEVQHALKVTLAGMSAFDWAVTETGLTEQCADEARHTFTQVIGRLRRRSGSFRPRASSLPSRSARWGRMERAGRRNGG